MSHNIQTYNVVHDFANGHYLGAATAPSGSAAKLPDPLWAQDSFELVLTCYENQLPAATPVYSNFDQATGVYLYVKLADTDDTPTTLDAAGVISATLGTAVSCVATNATNLFTDVAHGLVDNDRVRIGGTVVPTGITAATTYYVISATTDTFQVSATLGGAAVTFSDDGTAVTYQFAWYNIVTFTVDKNDLLEDYAGSAQCLLYAEISTATRQRTVAQRIYITDENGDDTASLNAAEVNGWTTLISTKYTAVPTDTNTLAMSDTSDMAVGYPLEYTIGGTKYYGIVKSISADTSIDVYGASLSGTLTKLRVGSPARVGRIIEFIDSTYADGVEAALLDVDMDTARVWTGPDACVVRIQPYHKTADTYVAGAEPIVNFNIGGAGVCSDNTNGGVEVSTAKTWYTSTDVGISTTYYKLDSGEAYEIACTQAGTNGDAAYLTMIATYVIV